MKHIRKIFAWLMVIAGLHITEQFLFGLFLLRAAVTEYKATPEGEELAQ